MSKARILFSNPPLVLVDRDSRSSMHSRWIVLLFKELSDPQILITDTFPCLDSICGIHQRSGQKPRTLVAVSVRRRYQVPLVEADVSNCIADNQQECGPEKQNSRCKMCEKRLRRKVTYTSIPEVFNIHPIINPCEGTDDNRDSWGKRLRWLIVSIQIINPKGRRN